MSIKALREEKQRQYRNENPLPKFPSISRSLKAEFDAVCNMDYLDDNEVIEPSFLVPKRTDSLSYRQYISSFR